MHRDAMERVRRLEDINGKRQRDRRSCRRDAEHAGLPRAFSRAVVFTIV